MTDENQAAILRRRAELIALALSGLTGCVPGAAPKDPPAHAEPAAIGPVLVPVPDGPPPIPEIAEPPWEPPAEADAAEVAHAEERKRRLLEPARPCLSVACLSPAVCLWKKAWDDDEPVD